MDRVCLLDPSITSRDGEPPANLGDLIIRQAVVRELADLFPGAEVVSVPTQLPLLPAELDVVAGSDHVVVGGTNLLSSHVSRYRQWHLTPADAGRIGSRVVLLGVGWWQYQDDPDAETAALLRSALSATGVHSVRDGYARDKLAAIGLANVVNTGCPTMWPLAAAGRRPVPTEKADAALVMLTDYAKDRRRDAALLDLLFDRYPRVYFWPQGSGDDRYAAEFDRPLIRVDRSLAALDQLLVGGEPIDAIGTRLHGGVRCLLGGHRTLVIGIDNRAAEIARHTRLPVVPRGRLDLVSNWIDRSRPLDLQIDGGAIRRFKAACRAGTVAVSAAA